MHSGLVISQVDGRPMYLQLMEQIRRRIALGDWLPGQELPSIRGLAADTQVSVITIKRAYSELEREGVIVTRQGRGTFVAEDAGIGRQLHEEELDRKLAEAVEAAEELGLSVEELEARLRRVVRQRGVSR